MNRICALIFFLSLPTANLHATEKDKIKHAQYSFIISSAVYVSAKDSKHPILYPIIATMAIGLAKELSDPFIDQKDLQYDLLGATIAPLFWMSF